MKANKPEEKTPDTKNYDLLYRLYDFILSPEWDALGREEDGRRQEAAGGPSTRAQTKPAAS